MKSSIWRWLASGVILMTSVIFAGQAAAAPKAHNLKAFEVLSPESQECAACHKDQNRGLFQQWGESKHYGANVGCYECHQANPTDKDAIKHEGFNISVVVSPKDCGQCHDREAEQFSQSHHAKAGRILGSLDNMLAEVVEGKLILNGASPVAVSGCGQCHGSVVKVLENGDLDPATWPNSGIGRINPDGSEGSCNACHQRHEFDIVQARRPEACGKCHLGPDHPQKEIYEESKHGIAFYGNVDDMNLDSAKWIVGEDYDAAPTCATCHMSGTKDLPLTHDVGDRISWTLRPPVSEKIDAKKRGKVKSWEHRRKDMKNVCSACHTSSWVENFYVQFDGVVTLYNDKFAKPGVSMMKFLKDEGLRTDTGFDEKIEWTWFYLWHHQGRRARMGAAMGAPDYVQWHGMFEVAEAFYTELVPEYREFIEKAEHDGKHDIAKRGNALLEEILSRPEHAWFSGKEPEAVKAARKKAQAEFQKRYAQ
ncbi:multiheme c-type cytochrome [Pelagibaculum spongiae]|uniref:Hydroxylamine oxidoreductase n=1 Tax=Pelagibaculum spongiae TaxID=2080658 RepID=A0A2V1GQP8_9GAMM|nr:multiheme c-type cytochrome [Pelagibaculum spongiae]PVZ66388.1 hydroxylamine oxidoreductase [Pelagibaculum spongiae]